MASYIKIPRGDFIRGFFVFSRHPRPLNRGSKGGLSGQVGFADTPESDGKEGFVVDSRVKPESDGKQIRSNPRVTVVFLWHGKGGFNQRNKNRVRGKRF